MTSSQQGWMQSCPFPGTWRVARGLFCLQGVARVALRLSGLVPRSSG